MKKISAIVFFSILIPSFAAVKGVCEVLEETPRRTSGSVVELEARLNGWFANGYKLFDTSSKSRCNSSVKNLQLRPILAFCSMEPERCPDPGLGSKVASEQLKRIVTELNLLPRKKGFRGVRLKLRAILVYPPEIQVMCDDDVCWGSGFGDGSIAAAIIPLAIERLD